MAGIPAGSPPTLMGWKLGKDLAGYTEIADETIDAFSKAHPEVNMTWTQWMSLHECIENAVKENDDLAESRVRLTR